MFDVRKMFSHTLRVANDGNGGEDWATALVKRVGRAMKAARGSRSAAWLSERTEALGYKISPTVIAKLDTGHRGSVLSVPEWLILAAALDLPPALLAFPGYPDMPVEVLPGINLGSDGAVRWLAGTGMLVWADSKGVHFGPNEETVHTEGLDLVAAAEAVRRTDRTLADLQSRSRDTDIDSETLESIQRSITQVREELHVQFRAIDIARTGLWGKLNAFDDELRHLQEGGAGDA